MQKSGKRVKLEPLDSAKPSEFMVLAQRLKEEHSLLNEQIDRLIEESQHASAWARSPTVIPMLDMLRSSAREFTQQLESHARWEDQELFPILSWYFGRRIEPTLLPSMWVLEKDHELALQFFESFLENSKTAIGMAAVLGDTGEPADGKLIKRAADQLTQGCFILKGHFQMEEELIFPMAEQILTDIDYLFS